MCDDHRISSVFYFCIWMQKLNYKLIIVGERCMCGACLCSSVFDISHPGLLNELGALNKKESSQESDGAT